MSSFDQVRPYPEWRQLKAAIEPLLGAGKKEFSYDELKELAGVDIRKKREQFYKFRRRALLEWNLWFEVRTKFGYVVLPASEQPQAATKRVGMARRKVKMAQAINGHVRIEDLTPAQTLAQAAMGAALSDLAESLNRTSRKLATAASKISLGLPEEALKALSAPSAPPRKHPGRAGPSSLKIGIEESK